MVTQKVKRGDEMTYFETLPNMPGLNKPPSNPFKLLDFNHLKLADGETFKAASEGREVLVVVLGGKGTFIVNDRTFTNVVGRPNVFAGKPHSVYIPCNADYAITANGSFEAGLVSAPSDLKTEPYTIGPEKITTGVWGAANFSRNYHQILTLAGQPDLPAKRLIVGETFTPSGNWSTFPPHRHEKDDLPREAWHEELYFFKVNPVDGFGLTRHYNSEVDTAYVVRDHTILMAPNGYHTVVSAPGYTTYYLWALAGNHRIQATADDPALAWVSRTVPMLKALGH
jgi:5-deoxy-glucuronate isomerase